jgi:hypothetical protein
MTVKVWFKFLLFLSGTPSHVELFNMATGYAQKPILSIRKWGAIQAR